MYVILSPKAWFIWFLAWCLTLGRDCFFGFYSCLRHDVRGVRGACGSEPPETVTDYQLRGRTGAPAARGTSFIGWAWVDQALKLVFGQHSQPFSVQIKWTSRTWRKPSLQEAPNLGFIVEAELILSGARVGGQKNRLSWLGCGRRSCRSPTRKCRWTWKIWRNKHPDAQQAHGPWEVHPKLIP